jgi:hypothetical protein
MTGVVGCSIRRRPWRSRFPFPVSSPQPPPRVQRIRYHTVITVVSVALHMAHGPIQCGRLPVLFVSLIELIIGVLRCSPPRAVLVVAYAFQLCELFATL